MLTEKLGFAIRIRRSRSSPYIQLERVLSNPLRCPVSCCSSFLPDVDSEEKSKSDVELDQGPLVVYEYLAGTPLGNRLFR